MSVVAFIERKFIPEHVRLKSTAGRVHYKAILKHIVKPEMVQRHFAHDPLRAKARLKAVHGWPYMDDVRMCDIEADHVRQLTTSALARGYSAQTVKHIKSVISVMISHAQKEGLFDGFNPAAIVRLPRVVHTTPRDLTIEEAKSVLRVLKSPEREIALISMSTGIGASDICNLRWKHVNLTRSEVFIEGEQVPSQGLLIRGRSTGFEGAGMKQARPRVIVLCNSLTRELERLKLQREYDGPNSFIIARSQGSPIQLMSARTLLLRKAGRKLHLPWLSWRALKRAHIAMLSELRIQLTEDLARMAQPSGRFL
jgi:integrase